MELAMHNSLIVRTAIVVLVLGAGLLGFLGNEVLALGEPFLAGLCIPTVVLFAAWSFDLTDR
jgi:hypothetical protein